MKEAVIVSAVRTPVAKFRGALAGFEVPDLAALSLKAVVEKAGIKPEQVDEVVMGNLFGSDWGNPARTGVLRAGFPQSVPAITIDRQCSSSLNALAFAASIIQSGACDIVIAAGVESYSQQPFYVQRPDSPYPGAMQVLEYKSAHPALGNPSMIETAENLAKKYKLTREECDAFALKSHKNAAASWEAGYFADQIVPVTIPQRKGDPVRFAKDECVRGDATLEGMAKLKPIIPGGIVTAGNSSPMNDGSAAALVMSREKAAELKLQPLAVVGPFASAGCDPLIMGIGPVYSTRRLMERTGLTLKDFDYIELNEAFAAQSLSVIKELNLDPERVNVEGGAIAIGHPYGASGGILIARMIGVLQRRKAKRGLITFCCGGGQGFSLVLERD
jgi:acetyl-CoA C-acetyltransferase